MVHFSRKIEPNSENKLKYDKVYAAYKLLGSTVAGISHYLASDYKKSEGLAQEPKNKNNEIKLRSSSNNNSNRVKTCFDLPSGRASYIVPYILSADFGSISAEVRSCYIAGAEWVHIDICDGILFKLQMMISITYVCMYVCIFLGAFNLNTKLYLNLLSWVSMPRFINNRTINSCSY